MALLSHQELLAPEYVQESIPCGIRLQVHHEVGHLLRRDLGAGYTFLPQCDEHGQGVIPEAAS